MSRLAALFLIFTIYVLGAASSYCGYFSKWAFWDGNSRNSFVKTMTFQASRPFVYRQLIPQLSKSIGATIPEARRAEMAAHWSAYPELSSIYGHATDADKGPYVVEYHIAYMLCFSFWFFALMMLARICQDVTHDPFASLAAPLIFALIFPILLTRGGYFYDPVEIFFFALSVYLASRGRFIALVLVTPLASFNKETFLFWLPCLWYMFPARVIPFKRVLVLGAAMVVSGTAYLVNRARFSSNAGGPVEFHLLENLRFYFSSAAYFRREYTYGLALPAGVSLINLTLIASLIYLGWRELPIAWRRHIFVALIVNMPLFLMFCWLDELRNLSLMFVALTVLIACVVHRGVIGAARPPRPPLVVT